MSVVKKDSRMVDLIQQRISGLFKEALNPFSFTLLSKSKQWIWIKE